MFCVSLLFFVFLVNVVADMCDYERERMNNCLRNNEYMRQLGLNVRTGPFANTEINSDDDPSDDNPGPEKDDCLQELDTTISSLLADKVLLIPYWHV
jgi:hypothetical protein